MKTCRKFISHFGYHFGLVLFLMIILNLLNLNGISVSLVTVSFAGEYDKRISKLNTIKSHIISNKELLFKILKEQQNTNVNDLNPQEKQKVIDQLTYIKKEIEKLRKDYQEQLTSINYHFPENSLQPEGKYLDFPLEDTEKFMLLEEKLTKTKEKIHKIYTVDMNSDNGNGSSGSSGSDIERYDGIKPGLNKRLPSNHNTINVEIGNNVGNKIDMDNKKNPHQTLILRR